MRRPQPHDPLARWLQAEREADDAGAEAALLELFESVPRPAPSAGFADRVLQRVALSEKALPVPARESWIVWLLRSPGFRLVLASCLLTAGVALLFLPQMFMALARMVTLGDMLQLGVASVVDLGRWLGVAARVGEWLLTVLGALAVSLTSPAAIKVMAACLAISGMSIALLRELMTRDRSLSYVDPIR